MTKLYTYIVFGFLMLGVKSYAQDPIFTQYFLIPETQNPSFTGFLESTRTFLLATRCLRHTRMALSVDTAPIAQAAAQAGLTGPKIGEQITQARVRAIQQMAN